MLGSPRTSSPVGLEGNISYACLVLGTLGPSLMGHIILLQFPLQKCYRKNLGAVAKLGGEP